MSNNFYTEEYLIEKLQQFIKENGGYLPKSTEFGKKNNLPSFCSYTRAFKNYKNIFKTIGIDLEIMKKQNIKEEFIKFYNKIGHVPCNRELKIEKEVNKSIPNSSVIRKYYGTISNLAQECNMKNIWKENYSREELINEIKRFVKEFGRVPIVKDFENSNEYPSRKTFTNHFESLNEAIRLAGFEPVGLNMKENHEEKYNKEYLLNLIFDFKNKYGKVPTIKELHKELGLDYKLYYQKVFGSWNNALKEANLPLNSVSQYDDEFLHSEFERFVKTNSRIPTYAEFNNSEYPSFWCYQSRFGSWNKAVVAYGYEPNDKNRKYILENGEICASSYEHDISLWLQKENVKYDRNILYIDIDTNGYKGKMDCDYKIYINNEIWYVEMAGFLSSRDFKKLSREEQIYYFKLQYKKKLLKRSEVKYLIIYPSHLKEKSMEDIFYFLN